MLYQLLAETKSRINNLNIEEIALDFLDEFNEANPQAIDKLVNIIEQQENRQELYRALATMYLTGIKEIPEITDNLVEILKHIKTPPALRCALAAGLAYLVQPRDLIPDNTPAGYGYTDDCLILNILQREYLLADGASKKQMQHVESRINMMALALPSKLIPSFQQTIQGMSMAFQLSALLPPEILNMTAQQYILNPLQATMPSAPPGFAPNNTFNLGGGRPMGGSWVETQGNNTHVIFPGGGGVSLVGGKLTVL